MILYILFINSFLAAFSSMRHKYLNKIIGRRKNHGQRGVEQLLFIWSKTNLGLSSLEYSYQSSKKKSARLTH